MTWTWDCHTGTDHEDHDWEFKSDWSGDLEVIGGTYNFHYKVCRVCGKLEDWDGSKKEHV